MQISEQTLLVADFRISREQTILPALYNEAFDQADLNCRCMSFELTTDLIEKSMDAIRTLRMIGAHISSPLSSLILPYLDDTDQSVRLCGAANAVVNDNGRLIGYFLPGTAGDEITVQSDTMLSQCAAAFRLWTGRDMPLDYIKLWLSVSSKQQVDY